MDSSPVYRNGGRTTTVVNGRGILHRHMSKLQAAARAAQQHLGEAVVVPSRKQAAEDWGVSTTYVQALEKVSVQTRAAIADGKYRPSFLSIVRATAPTVDADDTEVTGRMTEEELLKGLEGLAPPEPAITEADLIGLGPERLLNAAVAAESRQNGQAVVTAEAQRNGQAAS
jgi:hypothetical protein